MEITLIRDTNNNVTAVNVILSERNLDDLSIAAFKAREDDRFKTSLHRTVESGLRLNVHIERDADHYAKREPVIPFPAIGR